jgi:hypothetical protein
MPQQETPKMLRIQIRRTHVFLGALDPDPLVRGMDPDPNLPIITQKKVEKP